jgi:single-stranded-DNA-specific exonuclease
MQRNCFAIALNEITHRFTNELARFEPFGQSNPEPLFYTTGARVVAPPQVLKDKHLKLMVEQRGMRLEALGWNMAAEQDLAMAVAVNGAPAPIAGVGAGATVDLAFRIETTTHPQYGRRTQLILKDRPSCG